MKAESHLGIWLSPVLRNYFRNLLFFCLKSDIIIQGVYLQQMHSLNLQQRKRKQRQGVKICAGVHMAKFSVLWDKLCFVRVFSCQAKGEKIPSSLLPLAAKLQHHLWGDGMSSQLTATSTHFCSARKIKISGHNTQAQHKVRQFNNPFSKLLITSNIYKGKHFGKKFYQE